MLSLRAAPSLPFRRSNRGLHSLSSSLGVGALRAAAYNTNGPNLTLLVVRRSFIRPPDQEGAIYKIMMKPREPLGGMTLTQLNFHICSTCSVAAMLCTDMLALRTLAIAGSSFLAAFQYYRPVPLYPQMKWNAFFLSVNAFMTTVLLVEVWKADNLPTEMQELYIEGKFDERGFSKVQFMKFFACGHERAFVRGDHMAVRGQRQDKLYYVISGKAAASGPGNSKLGYVSPHHFIGEMSLLNHIQNQQNAESNETCIASATVSANGRVRAWEWDHDDVERLLSYDRDLGNAFNSYCSHDLRRKLLAANRKGGLPGYLREKYQQSGNN